MNNYNLYIKYHYGIVKYPVNSLAQVKSTAYTLLRDSACLSVALVDAVGVSVERVYTRDGMEAAKA